MQKKLILTARLLGFLPVLIIIYLLVRFILIYIYGIFPSNAEPIIDAPELKKVIFYCIKEVFALSLGIAYSISICPKPKIAFMTIIPLAIFYLAFGTYLVFNLSNREGLIHQLELAELAGDYIAVGGIVVIGIRHFFIEKKQ